MIKGIIGKPGGGKSFLAVRLIVDELVEGKRHIVTNVALRIGELADYLNNKYGETFDLVNRITFIQDEQIKQFWLHRVDYMVNGVKKAGCMFVLDELHRLFNARQWAENGKDKGKSCLDYLSAHRHFGDDIVYITQATAFLDKYFVQLTQDFTLLRNMGKEKWGFFRAPGLFNRRVFLKPPTGVNDTCIESSHFRLDIQGLAKCYNTASLDDKVGLGPADKEQKTKGMHWSWAPAALAVLAVLLILFFTHVPGWIKKGIVPGFDNSETNKTAVVKPVRIVPTPALSGAVSNAALPKTNIAIVPPKLSGAYILNGKWTVLLADGGRIRDTQIYGNDTITRMKNSAEVGAVDDGGALVRIDGKYVYCDFQKVIGNPSGSGSSSPHRTDSWRDEPLIIKRVREQ